MLPSPYQMCFHIWCNIFSHKCVISLSILSGTAGKPSSMLHGKAMLLPPASVLHCLLSKSMVYNMVSVHLCLLNQLLILHWLWYYTAGQTLYPLNHFCWTPNCPQTLKGMCIIHAEQWQCMLYTVSDGPLPVYLGLLKFSSVQFRFRTSSEPWTSSQTCNQNK